MRSQNLILVLGATGTVGRRIVDRLVARGVSVRSGSRSGTPPFDWTDESTWAGALDGVAAAYLFFPDLAVTSDPVTSVRRLTSAAVAAGVGRLVLLTGRGDPPAQEAEKIVLSAGVEAAVVRAAFFAQNFDEKDFVEWIRAGTMALPVGPVGEPFVDADDIADVAVAALVEDGHAGQIYEVTGPRLLTFAEAVDEIAEALGRPVTYEQISPEEFTAALREQGLPTDAAEAVTTTFVTELDGHNSFLTDGVHRALGREPRDFADYARAAAAGGGWEPRA